MYLFSSFWLHSSKHTRATQNLKCTDKHRENIKIVIIKICSGNSSECRLEVAAARLADHGTWTCSLSQDKVRICCISFFGHGLGFVVSAMIR